MTVGQAVEGAKKATQSGARIVSVDALRGFDMFWIVGADHLVRGLKDVSDAGWASAFAKQLKHVSWEGFVFYDLIFPLFVFLVGMSIVFSLSKHLDTDSRMTAYKRILRRFALLFLLGMFYDQGLSNLAHESPFSGVLQRLAWCYLFGSLLYVHLKLRGLIAAFLLIVVGYWALLTFVPKPGREDVSFDKHENICNYIDLKYLPMKEEGQRYDPEGLLSTVPAVASCLLGVFAGMFLRNKTYDDKKKVGYLIGCGIAMVVLGYLWGLQLPIIKRLWTSSYVIVAGGYCCVLMGLFYLVIDVWKLRKWAIPFIWIGANPLTIYLAEELVGSKNIGVRLVGGPIAEAFGKYGELVISAAGILAAIMFVRFLYKRQIFLRV